MYRSRVLWRLACIGIAALLSSPALAQGTPAPAALSVCSGKDLLAAVEDKEARARIEAAAKVIPNGEAELWKVSKSGVEPSYLLGTIHISDDRVTSLPQAADAALEKAQRVALEVADLSPGTLLAAMAKQQTLMVLQGDKSLDKMLAPDELSVAGAAMAKVGFPQAAVVKLRPWLVTMMLAIPDCERARLQTGREPLDLKIGKTARDRGLPVLGLETVEQQLVSLASVPDADQLAMLRATLKTYAQAGDMMETIVQRYLKREVAKVLPLQRELLAKIGLDGPSFGAFYKALLTDRNPRMTKAAEALIDQGGAFIAVGALHLVGDDGIVARLRKDGYDVTAVE
ncbi:MAG: TraB/GumN family protein [Proteobacteria bacterium]|nr:TraB/GumN family protein [Pseudomonadota bacterium]